MLQWHGASRLFGTAGPKPCALIDCELAALWFGAMGKLWKRRSSGNKPSSRQTAGGSSDGSDISLMSEDSDWEAERAALRANLAAASTAAPVDPFEAAAMWAEVRRWGWRRIWSRIAALPAAAPAAAPAAPQHRLLLLLNRKV